MGNLEQWNDGVELAYLHNRFKDVQKLWQDGQEEEALKAFDGRVSVLEDLDNCIAARNPEPNYFYGKKLFLVEPWSHISIFLSERLSTHKRLAAKGLDSENLNSLLNKGLEATDTLFLLSVSSLIGRDVYVQGMNPAEQPAPESEAA